MSMADDPIRLRRMAAGGSLLERGLEAAQASGPTEEQLQALERRVLAGLGATAVATAAVTMTKTAGSHAAGAAAGWLSAGSAKLIVALVATVTVGGGSVVVWHAANKSGRGPAAVVTPTRVSPGVSRQRPELPDPMQNPASELAAPGPAQSPPSLPAGTSAASAHPMLAPEPIVAGSPRADHRPVAESTARWMQPSREPAIAPPPAASGFRKFEASKANSGESASGTVDEELALLVRANRALVKSPASALTLADEHTRRFPASGMDQERELIAITALVDLGQTAEAHRRAAQFTRAHPGSIYQPRIDKALAPRH